MSETGQAGQHAGEARKIRQEKVGRVVSSKMDKTIVVEVTRRVPHPVYKRVVQRRKKFYAHDEANRCNVGDVVRIVESRPLSRLKRWRLAEVLRRARGVGLADTATLPSVDEAGKPDPGPGGGLEGTGTGG